MKRTTPKETQQASTHHSIHTTQYLKHNIQNISCHRCSVQSQSGLCAGNGASAGQGPVVRHRAGVHAVGWPDWVAVRVATQLLPRSARCVWCTANKYMYKYRKPWIYNVHKIMNSATAERHKFCYFLYWRSITLGRLVFKYVLRVLILLPRYITVGLITTHAHSGAREFMTLLPRS